MQTILQRFRNTFTYYGIAAVVLGVGMNLFFAFAPNVITSPSLSKTLSMIGLGLVVLAVILFIIGFFETPASNVRNYYGIIPLLQKMDNQIIKIAKKETRKEFDLETYKKIHNKYNKDVLKMETSKAKTIKGLKRSAKSLETSLNKTLKDEVHSIRDGIYKLEAMSTFMDINGFGLKQQRLTDKKYLRLSKKLQYYRNLPIGTEIDDLISLHLTYSESSAVLLLTTIRDGRIKVQEGNIKLLDLVSTNMQITIEQAEKVMNQTTSKIRARIGQCIRVLESSLKTGQKNQPTIGIDADDSLINAPSAKIINQDIGIKSTKSVINIPDSTIKDERKRDER